MPEQELKKGQLLADLVTHSGYKVLMEDIFEDIIKFEEKVLWSVPGPKARAVQVEIVATMRAYLTKAKTKISNTIKDAQAAERNRDVQETQRTGRR